MKASVLIKCLQVSVLLFPLTVSAGEVSTLFSKSSKLAIRMNKEEKRTKWFSHGQFSRSFPWSPTWLSRRLEEEEQVAESMTVVYAKKYSNAACTGDSTDSYNKVDECLTAGDGEETMAFLQHSCDSDGITTHLYKEGDCGEALADDETAILTGLPLKFPFGTCVDSMIVVNCTDLFCLASEEDLSLECSSVEPTTAAPEDPTPFGTIALVLLGVFGAGAIVMFVLFLFWRVKVKPTQVAPPEPLSGEKEPVIGASSAP